MKRSLLFLLIGMLPLSCAANKFSYSDLIKQLKSYGEEYLWKYDATGKAKYYYYFMIDDSGKENLALKTDFENETTIDYIFIELPDVKEVPSSFSCLFSSYYYIPEYDDFASFNLSNSIYFNFKVTFSQYLGDDKETAQDVAASSTSLLLLSFDIWLKENLNIDLHQVGLFPNFREVK